MSERARLRVHTEAAGWPRHLPGAGRYARQAAGRAMTRVLGRAHGWAATVALVDDATIRGLNRRHRKIDRATDVLSFPASAVAVAQLRHIGDVFVAFETCARGAARGGVRLEDHVRHLVVHGVLHLAGYDHVRAGQTRDMRAREREILATMGIADPYRPAKRRAVKRQAGR